MGGQVAAALNSTQGSQLRPLPHVASSPAPAVAPAAVRPTKAQLAAAQPAGDALAREPLSWLANRGPPAQPLLRGQLVGGGGSMQVPRPAPCDVASHGPRGAAGLGLPPPPLPLFLGLPAAAGGSTLPGAALAAPLLQRLRPGVLMVPGVGGNGEGGVGQAAPVAVVVPAAGARGGGAHAPPRI
jgi:hypothetical protein